MDGVCTERRKHPRFDLECRAQLISPDGEMVITALTTNISDGGLRIPLPTECLPECGLETQVKLIPSQRQPNDTETYLRCGKVVRHTRENEDGIAEIALMFDKPMNLRLQEQILRLSV